MSGYAVVWWVTVNHATMVMVSLPPMINDVGEQWSCTGHVHASVKPVYVCYCAGMSTPFDNHQAREWRAGVARGRAERRAGGSSGSRGAVARVSPRVDAVPPKGRWLYRMYSASDRLLYVGITDRGHVREREHARSKPWWAEVHHVHYERFVSRAALESAERLAIRSERPVYNVQHNR
jgi:predicted GIY-YIG superfamily endonuclease